jgi:hypothetical protein
MRISEMYRVGNGAAEGVKSKWVCSLLCVRVGGLTLLS